MKHIFSDHKLMFSLVFLTFSLTAKDSEQKKSILCDIKRIVEQIEGALACTSTTSFGHEEINQPGGFVITKSGKYCLRENAHEKSAQVAVTIQASNVVLDLNGFTLFGDKVGTVGIDATGSTNLIIRNGTIRNFAVTGMQINSSESIILNNLLSLRNGTVNGVTTTGGLGIYNSKYITMWSVHLVENYGFGLGMSGINTANFLESSADGTKGTNGHPIFGNVAYGIFVSSTSGVAPFTKPSSNLNFVECTFNNTIGGDSAFGVAIDSLPLGVPPSPNANIVFLECTANNTTQTNTSPASGPFVEGITIAGAFNVTIKECAINTLTAAATNGNAASHLVGIEVGDTSYATIDSCTVSQVTGIANYVHAFDIEGSGNDITFKNCSAYHVINTIKNAAFPAFALGFGILKPINLPGLDIIGSGAVVQNCIAQDIHAPHARGVGLLLNAEQNAVIENNIFSNSDIGILTTVVNPPALRGKFSIVRNNVTNGNSIAGIKDTTDTKVTAVAYYGNTARANGTNFAGLPTGTPIVTWTIGTPPSSSGGVLDNYDIRP